MCGICAIYVRGEGNVEKGDVEVMNGALAHRGPDGAGLYIERRIGLGHRRLSILDLETGNQPMCNEDGSVWTVFNGEIYNFLEIRKDLEGRGHVFKSRSDTESIIHGYEEWGTDFVCKLRGMFSIVIWDARKEKVVFARDRIGKKPLYYFLSDRILCVASELKSFADLKWISKDVDLEALDAYLTYGFIPSPLTIFKSIRKLPPAHIAICGAREFHTHEYWTLEVGGSSVQQGEEQAAEELNSILDEATKMRLISDVPLGAFLSGGFDSSAVVAKMTRLSGAIPVRTTAIGFSDRRYDELKYSRIVSNALHTSHTEYTVQPDALQVIAKIVWHLDEPFADSSAVPTYYLSQMARRSVKVALSGDGGDEVFGGYIRRYWMTRFEDNIRKHVPAYCKAVITGLAHSYPRSRILPKPFRLKSFLTNIACDFEQAYCRDMSFYYLPEMKAELYSGDLRAQMVHFDCYQYLLRHLVSSSASDPLARAQYVDIKTYLPEDILTKVDRMSMAHGLEVRSPLLDHKIIEFAARLNCSMKLRGRTSKYIFKKAMRDQLPDEVMNRKKQGFSVPLARWLRNELKEFAQEALFCGNGIVRDYFNIGYIARMWKRHIAGLQDNSSQLWALIMLEWWRRTFRDVSSSGNRPLEADAQRGHCLRKGSQLWSSVRGSCRV